MGRSHGDELTGSDERVLLLDKQRTSCVNDCGNDVMYISLWLKCLRSQS